MENPISITALNDFVFCPASIYFHSLDIGTDTILYQDEYQINGTNVHAKVDNCHYSDKLNILQGMTVYSEEYNLIGKIDIFDMDKGILTERKNIISKIYDGYVFQLYGQYFALKEMDYIINEIRFYSYSTNKVYPVNKPEDDYDMFAKFKQIILDIDNFNLNNFKQTNADKCLKCIYEPLCCYCEV